MVVFKCCFFLLGGGVGVLWVLSLELACVADLTRLLCLVAVRLGGGMMFVVVVTSVIMS